MSNLKQVAKSMLPQSVKAVAMDAGIGVASFAVCDSIPASLLTWIFGSVAANVATQYPNELSAQAMAELNAIPQAMKDLCMAAAKQTTNK